MRARLALCLLLSGCVAPLSGALKAARTPVDFSAPQTKARVIFMQGPNWLSFGQGPYLLDGVRGLVIGHSLPASYFAVELDPGTYELCPAPITLDRMGRPTASAAGFSERTGNLLIALSRLTFAAGNTYLVEVKVGFRRIDLELVWPALAGEEGLRAAVRELRPAEFDPGTLEVESVSAPATFDAWYSVCWAPPQADAPLPASAP